LNRILRIESAKSTASFAAKSDCHGKYPAVRKSADQMRRADWQGVFTVAQMRRRRLSVFIVK
jgi:hypothetical protein